MIRRSLTLMGGLGLLAGAILVAGSGGGQSRRGEPIPPIWSVTVSVTEESRSAFLQALERFAGDNGFRFRIAEVAPDGVSVSYSLWREDVQAAGGPNPWKNTEYALAFYHGFNNADGTRRADLNELPQNQATAEALAAQLKERLGGLKDVIVTDNQMPPQ